MALPAKLKNELAKVDWKIDSIEEGEEAVVSFYEQSVKEIKSELSRLREKAVRANKPEIHAVIDIIEEKFDEVFKR